jgi:tetratricopeptide (TPR) repeat protein
VSPLRYGAFLSYSHTDEAHARWLLRRLEGFRVPPRLVGTSGRFGPVPARLGPVFRDRDELPTAGDLGSTITVALEASAALVVLCSPAAAQSRWVNAEVAAFRALGRGDRILCFVVGGDPGARAPGQACFPPALLAPDVEGGPPREPLAADARDVGDGRDRAFLRLAAGLLGVGYDDLAQREGQRRQRRLALVAAVSVAVTAGALALGATAWVARNDAQRRQAQAEDLLGFMLGDLRRKLTTVGRLDLMRTVDDKATEYFAALDPRDLSDRALEAQARSLAGIGEVRLGEGDHDAALEAFREAHARSTMLSQREPDNGQRLFDRAQAEYWLGFVALRQGRHDDAGEWLRKYRDSAIRLAAMDRDNFDWQLEMAYGHQNLAVLDETLGRYAEAERSMLAQLDLYRGWVGDRPDDLGLRSELANVASWLGSVAMRQGRLAEAERFFLEQVDALRLCAEEDPRNVLWQQYLSDAWLLLGDAQVHSGRREEARASVAQAASIAARLSVRDPSNNYWRLSLGRTRWWQAQLAATERPTTAAAVAADAASLLGAAHEAEPRDERVLTWFARTRGLQARLALGRGDVGAARAHVDAARALLEPAWRAARNEALRLWLAGTLTLHGEIAAREGDAAAAATAWREARAMLLEDAAPEVPFSRLDLLVRALLHLGAESEANSHRQRLERAGYVPLQPFPAGAGAGGG